jgi:thiamine-monophosphate kinase
MKIRDIGEIGLIKRFAKKIRVDSSVVKGSGDDTAVLKWTKDKYLLFTCDMLVEDVHFKRSIATPLQIGHKALARNISDIAAMGGLPRHAVVSMAIDPEMDVKFADKIVDGMIRLAKRYGINIVGGDVSRSKKIVIDVSLLGEVEKNNMVTRSGAKAGDLILLTGAIGGSIRGKHLDFTPRVREARELVSNCRVNSMIDVSDGLLLDLGRILKASNVGGRIREDLVPLSKEARSFGSAVTDGEDFELLFTMSPGEAAKLTGMRLGAAVSLIGQITDKKRGFTVVGKDGIEYKVNGKGYLHF